MRTILWSLTVLATTLLAFLAGYVVSTDTGIEPGYFEAAEAGSYGAPASEGEVIEGISEEEADYYKELTSQDESG